MSVEVCEVYDDCAYNFSGSWLKEENCQILRNKWNTEFTKIASGWLIVWEAEFTWKDKKSTFKQTLVLELWGRICQIIVVKKSKLDYGTILV
jgi:hypothetical protein